MINQRFTWTRALLLGVVLGLLAAVAVFLWLDHIGRQLSREMSVQNSRSVLTPQDRQSSTRASDVQVN